jgi:hypothetical protein
VDKGKTHSNARRDSDIKVRPIRNPQGASDSKLTGEGQDQNWGCVVQPRVPDCVAALRVLRELWQG